METSRLVHGEPSTDYATPDEGRVAYLDRVKASGLDVVVPNSHEIQIDIDSEEDFKRYKELVHMLSDHGSWVSIDSIVTIPSRNGLPGRHVTIIFAHEVGDWERIAWQAALGSDLKRELFSCIRMNRGEIIPVCFFEKSK